MTSAEFKARVLPLVEEELKKMPCMWPTENNADNAWDMLIEMWPDNEPGMGFWDQIRDVILAWICGVLEKQPLDDIKDYWDENADHDDFYYDNREQVEEHGAAPWFPPHREMCEDITEELWDDVLSRAETEGDRRREEKEAFLAMWNDPRETLEMLADFFRTQLSSPSLDGSMVARLAQWVHVCSSIPFKWPKEIPTVRLRETGGGKLHFRFTYDGSRLELSVTAPANDLFIQPSEWECSFSLSLAAVNGDVFEHYERISSAGASDATRNFNVIFDAPAGDIPASFWR